MCPVSAQGAPFARGLAEHASILLQILRICAGETGCRPVYTADLTTYPSRNGLAGRPGSDLFLMLHPTGVSQLPTTKGGTLYLIPSLGLQRPRSPPRFAHPCTPVRSPPSLLLDRGYAAFENVRSRHPSE